jgi:hypothetical protein
MGEVEHVVKAIPVVVVRVVLERVASLNAVDRDVYSASASWPRAVRDLGGECSGKLLDGSVVLVEQVVPVDASLRWPAVGRLGKVVRRDGAETQVELRRGVGQVPEDVAELLRDVVREENVRVALA